MVEPCYVIGPQAIFDKEQGTLTIPAALAWDLANLSAWCRPLQGWVGRSAWRAGVFKLLSVPMMLALDRYYEKHGPIEIITIED